MSAKDVKDLRDRTGAGYLDCKKALDATGNIEKAIEWLKESGIAKAAKKSGRIAADGIILIKKNDNVAIICEINSETDFVARNEKFLNLAENINSQILENDVKDINDAKNLKIDGNTLDESLIQMTAIIGEKISLRRFEKLTKNDGENFGLYLHQNKKVATISLIEGGNEDIAKNISMHITALDPQFLNIESMNKDEISKKLEEFKKVAIDQGKPENIAIKIADGRLKKELGEVCLTNQEYIKGDGESVGEYLSKNSAKLINAIRFAVGEGIEKKKVDFAEEVNSQINNSQK